MQTIQVFSDEWFFQLAVMLVYISGFAFSLCFMELATCIYAELRGIETDLPTQEGVHRFVLRIRRYLRRRRYQKSASLKHKFIIF